MIAQTLTLYPFASDTAPAGMSVTANVSRQANVLAVHYSVVDPQSLVLIPPHSRFSARRDNLWQETCMEFFCSPKDSKAYWEFNLSPSGDWNVYHLDAYRQGLREENAFTILPFAVVRSADQFALDLQVDLSPLVHAEETIELGITAVIKTKHGDISYWALKHCGTQPDFHMRESFTLSF